MPAYINGRLAFIVGQISSLIKLSQNKTTNI